MDGVYRYCTTQDEMFVLYSVTKTDQATKRQLSAHVFTSNYRQRQVKFITSFVKRA